MLGNSSPGFATLAKTALRRRYDGFIGLKDCYSLTNLILARLFRSRLKTGWNSDRFRAFDRDVRSVSAPVTHKVEMMRRIGQLAGWNRVNTNRAWSWRQTQSPGSGETTRGTNRLSFSTFPRPTQSYLAGGKWAEYVQGCGLGEELS